MWCIVMKSIISKSAPEKIIFGSTTSAGRAGAPGICGSERQVQHPNWKESRAYKMAKPQGVTFAKLKLLKPRNVNLETSEFVPTCWRQLSKAQNILGAFALHL